jgi:hypothetical protein
MPPDWDNDHAPKTVRLRRIWGLDARCKRDVMDGCLAEDQWLATRIVVLVRHSYETVSSTKVRTY